MRLSLQPLLLLALSGLGAAVFEDEVGHIDFHHSLVGLPQVETTFFHRPRKEDKASLLYTLSDVGVIGAINPSSGAVVWRQQIADETTNGGGFLRAPEEENWVAAAYGHRVQVWNALTGRNIWQNDFKGQVKDLEIMELTEGSRKDVLVLYEEDGATVLRRLHSGLGSVVWEFRETSHSVPLQVSTDIAKVYVVSLHGSPASYNLRVTALDVVTGNRVLDFSIGTKGDVHAPKDVMFVGGNSAAPILAWTDDSLSKLRVNVLGTKSKQEFSLPADAASVTIHAPHIAQAQPHFLVHTRTTNNQNKAEVYHTDLKTGQVSKAYDLPLLSGLGAFSTSSSGSNVYFTRLTEDELLIVSSDTHAVLARWRFSPNADIEAVHAVSEVVKKPGGEGFAVRSAAVTKSEDWVMVRNGEVDWSRPEGMSAAVAAVWAEIPVNENLAKVLEEEAHTNPLSAYIHRVKRHVDDLQYLPDYLASLPDRFISGLLGGETVKKEGLHRDGFGFSKLIVLVTRRGRMYGLNTGNHGEVAWSTLALPQSDGEVLDVKGIFAKDDQGVVVVRGSRGDDVIIKSDNGQIVQRSPPGSTFDVANTALVDAPSGKWLLPFDESGQVGHIAPEWAPSQTIVLRTEDGFKGVKFTVENDKTVQNDIWQFKIRSDQTIVDTAAPPLIDPIASIGRVLGDRRVSYKYLNSNAVVVAAASKSDASLTVQLVDTISGQVLVSQSYQGVDVTKPISCTAAENWYACSFFGQYTLNDGTNRSIKGFQIVVSDLYESSSPNDRGPLGDAANFSSLNPVDTPTGPPLPHVVSQAYVLSQPIDRLSVSQTRQGIANRQILAYLPEAHAVVGLPRQLLDPRRPVGRDPTAPEMEAEGLLKYAPAIEIDPRTLVSHHRDVLGVKSIIATPAVVESTSLVVAYGLDVFGTRVAPSGVFDILGKGFNKISLIGTVVALFAGVMFLAPMVSLLNSTLRFAGETLLANYELGAKKADQQAMGDLDDSVDE